MTGLQPMSCAEVTELAGLFVLEALEPTERAAVVAHLAACPEAHAEMSELGAVLPALASLAEPLDAPATLKARVVTAVAREAAVRAPTARPSLVMPPAGPRGQVLRWRLPQIPAWASWASAIAAVLIVAVVGVWAIGVQTRSGQADERARVLSGAVAALAAPDSTIATISGSGSAAGASGFAVFPTEGGGYLVLVGLPEAPAGQTYQAWYLVDGVPSSAGLMSVDAAGFAVLGGALPPAGTNLVALTLEPAGGSAQPTSDPIAVGEVRNPS